MLTLLSEDGFIFEKAASSKSGNYKGPCPQCGGEDRFTVTPNDSYGGSFICNQCNFHGDKIKYLREYRGLTYFEACATLNLQPKFTYQSTRDLLNKENKVYTPKDIPNPPKAWINKTTQLTFSFFQNMMSAPGKLHRDFLTQKKSLTIETIKKARLGFNPSGMKFSKNSFGLPEDPEANKNTVWIAPGIVIPYFPLDEQLIRIRVRQENPAPGFGRYLMQTGSSSTFYICIGYNKSKPVVIVESELDAILINQEVGDLINVMATGSTTNYPCEISDKLIKDSSQVYVYPDKDQAGEKMGEWYKKNYSAKVLVAPFGKDPSESVFEGLNLREFILEQIKSKTKSKEPHQNEISQEIDSIKIPENSQEKIRKKIGKAHEPAHKHAVEINQIPPDEQSFKIPEENTQEIIQENTQEIIEKKELSRDCFGTGFCGSLQGLTCLVSGKDLFEMEKCPASPPRWKKWHCPSGAYSQVIIEPMLDRDRT